MIDIEKSFGISGKEYEKRLDLAGLTLNANALPGDKGGAFNPSGVRLGTPAVTTRGMGENEMKKIAEWMERVAKNEDTTKIREEVRSLAREFPLP